MNLDKLRDYTRLMRFDKPIGIFLLLWPTLWALWIAAQGWPDTHLLVIFTLGVILMRSAGCVINDYADREFDPHVQRTKNRPIAAGKVSPSEALGLFTVIISMALVLVLLLNWQTILLSLVAVVLAASYPFMKRYTYLPQLHLGAAFGWSVPMAFAAQTGTIPIHAWLLFFATLLWATAYDTIYAMVDRDDDIQIGVKSTAILFADNDRLIIGVIQGLLIFTLIMTGIKAAMGFSYYLALAAASGLIVYQQYLIKDRQPALCFSAFLNNNWFGAIIFLGILLNYLL